MTGFLDSFRGKVISSVWKDDPQNVSKAPKQINDKIALGVLLRIVAEADDKFLPDEENKIKAILRDFARIPDSDMDIIMQSIKCAAEERIDLYSFTREISTDLLYDAKVGIVENLFRVACSDKDLDHNEIEIIRKISGLLGVAHKEFIDAKIKIKTEYGLPIH